MAIGEEYTSLDQNIDNSGDQSTEQLIINEVLLQRLINVRRLVLRQLVMQLYAVIFLGILAAIGWRIGLLDFYRSPRESLSSMLALAAILYFLAAISARIGELYLLLDKLSLAIKSNKFAIGLFGRSYSLGEKL